jgi:hypothetical protein
VCTASLPSRGPVPLRRHRRCHTPAPARCLQPGVPCQDTVSGSTRGTNHARATTIRCRSLDSLCHRALRTRPKPGPVPGGGGSASPPRRCRQIRRLATGLPPRLIAACARALQSPATARTRLSLLIVAPRRDGIRQSIRTGARTPTCAEAQAASGWIERRSLSPKEPRAGVFAASVPLDEVTPEGVPRRVRPCRQRSLPTAIQTGVWAFGLKRRSTSGHCSTDESVV